MLVKPRYGGDLLDEDRTSAPPYMLPKHQSTHVRDIPVGTSILRSTTTRDPIFAPSANLLIEERCRSRTARRHQHKGVSYWTLVFTDFSQGLLRGQSLRLAPFSSLLGRAILTQRPYWSQSLVAHRLLSAVKRTCSELFPEKLSSMTTIGLNPWWHTACFPL